MHTTEIAVRFHELDCYGHVNHATYLTYFEIARVEALAAAGLPLDALQADGFQFVVIEAHVRFRRPATLGQRLTVESRITGLAGASTAWHQDLRSGSPITASVDLRAAITDRAGRPRRLPAALVEALAPLRNERA